jgi:6-phosphogluconate dehydrogenase
MGGSMTLLFAEHGLQVSMYDPSKDVMDKIIQQAKEQHISPTPTKHEDYSELCESLESPKVFIFSLPHGKTGDEVIDGLLPFLEAGDFIVDCANEHWSLSQSRQGRLITRSVNYVGCGVSGGYQSARRGPSMSPGGDAAAIQQLMPLLEKVAARDARGRSCVGRVGGGGAGHYVKMVHNGIEHGMMSAISECWKIMNSHLGMSYEEIGETFAAWNGEGELVCALVLLYPSPFFILTLESLTLTA